MAELSTGPSGTRTAQARIVDAAYDLFSRRGIRDVSVDEVIERAGIAKATLYRHFPSKTELVLAFLQAREQHWTFAAIQDGARARADQPEQQLLAIFDVFDVWFHREDFEACSFINVLLEMGASHPLGRASIGYLANIRTMVEGLALGAGLRDPVGFAKSWHILMKGSIISAAEGDTDAARRAKAMALALIGQHK
jgi:AcrR family transcriptional regulator